MKMTASWADRPVEQIRLLNPAFLGVVIWSFSRGYKQKKSECVPYELVFLAMSIVLHKSTREKLPRTTRTSLSAWLHRNPEVHIHFTERLIALKPFIKEALIFAFNGKMLEISTGKIVPKRKSSSMNRFLETATLEVNDCIDKALFLGKWFASSGTSSTIMALWGVKP